MKLYVSKSTITTEVETDTEIEIDLSKMDKDFKEELADALLTSMEQETIEKMLDYNNNLISAILVDHMYIKDREIHNLFFALETELETNELKEELMSLINKYNLEL